MGVCKKFDTTVSGILARELGRWAHSRVVYIDRHTF